MTSKFPRPKVAATRTPKVDDYIKQIVSPATDKELAKIQTFVMDAVASHNPAGSRQQRRDNLYGGGHGGNH